MGDEIAQLQELKDQLLTKALKLRDKLKDQEENGHRTMERSYSTLHPDDEEDKQSKLLFTKHEAKLCKISGQVTRITFANVDKKWLHDDVYAYMAKVVTKMISFDLELVVVLKNSDDLDIKDIICHFDKDDYVIEVFPWFQKITATKNFSLLMSTISDYNEYSILRSKILQSLQTNNYARTEQCTEDNGGILVYMSSPVDKEKCYIIFQWKIKFLELTWHIEHFFTVKSTNTGIGFSEENRSLLKKFCEVGLTKNDLVELWDAMCVAIDDFHAKNTEDT